MKLQILTARAWLILFTLAVFSFASCQKESSENEQQQQAEADRTSAETSAEAEAIFSQVFDDVLGANDEVGMQGTGVFYGRTDSLSPVPTCFTVTVIRLNPPNPFPVKVIVDFGNGCMGPDGHLRRGKVITVYTARLIHPGAVAETTFENFYVDSVHVEGVHRIENLTTPNALLPRKFKVDVTNGKLTRPNGNYIHWNSHKVMTQIDGMVTPFHPLDDVYKIEGQATGTTKRGNLIVAWQSTIVEPLIRRFSCRWIVKGRIRTVRINTSTANSQVAILDFGNGHCDNQATLSINGTTHIITLP